jgi:fumarate reductase subunit C
VTPGGEVDDVILGGGARTRTVAASARRLETGLWLAQRASAAVLAVCVLVHLATIVYATRSGLSAQAILARTHASVAWPAFYAVFVVAVSVHAPIGLRAILDEWAALRGRVVDLMLIVLALVLLAGGLHVVGVMTG